MSLSSFFLNKGIIFAILSLSGNIPVESDWLIIVASGYISRSFNFFTKIALIRSNPELVLFSRVLIIFKTSGGVVSEKKKFCWILLCKNDFIRWFGFSGLICAAYVGPIS